MTQCHPIQAALKVTWVIRMEWVTLKRFNVPAWALPCMNDLLIEHFPVRGRLAAGKCMSDWRPVSSP